MKVSRTGRRLVVSGVATAVAAAGLVGASTGAATAADATKTGTSTYTCTFPVIGDQQVPVDMTIPNISAGFPTIPAGPPLEPGVADASYVIHADPTVAALLPSVDRRCAPTTCTSCSVTPSVRSLTDSCSARRPRAPTPAAVDIPATGHQLGLLGARRGRLRPHHAERRSR